MKRINIFLIIAAMLFTTTGCDKYLELEPSQSISEDQALVNDRNVKNVLLGAYSIFDNPSIYGGHIPTFSELLAGDGEINFEGTYTDFREISIKQTREANSYVRVLWTDAYRTINIVNNVLSAVDVVNEADQDRVEGEARFLRALIYFDLARLYGGQFQFGAVNDQLAVPLVLTPTRGISEENSVPRATVAAVYEQVITDLTIAATKLPVTNSVYSTQGAANALLARVYLQQGDYPNARNAANTVITSGTYQLRPTYSAVFNNDNMSTEDIFVTYITTQDRFSAMTEFWSIPQYGGRDGDIVILDGHLDLYDPGDARRDLFFVNAGRVFSGKWNNQYGVVNLIRLAEMYLIRAEANFRAGSTLGAEPVDDLNELRERAGFGDDYFATVDLADILMERRLELAHEGHKLFDVKRLQQSVGARPWNHPKFIFPIPFRELEANTSLVQNPDY